MPGWRATVNALDYLEKIATEIKDSGERLPEPKDLPRKVGEIVRILDAIERRLRPLNEPVRLGRNQLPKAIDDVLANHNAFRNIVDGVEREVCRATNKRLPLEHIVPQTKAIVDAIEAIELFVRPKDVEKMHFSQLQRRIDDVVNDNYDKYMSSKNLLTRIAHVIDPSDSASGKIEDLPSKVAKLVKNQASNHGISRARTKPISGQLDETESTSHEGGLERLTSEVNRLQGLLREHYQRNEELKREVKESNDSLKSAIEEAANHRNTLTTEHRIEVDKLKAKERNLRESHTRSVNRLEVEKSSAIADIEQIQDQEIKNIMAKHKKDLEKLQNSCHQTVLNVEKELVEQKAAFAKKTQTIQLQHTEELAVQRRNHSADKKRTGNQHQLEKEGLQGQMRDRGLYHEAELKKQRDHTQEVKAQWTQKLAEEVQQHELSRERAWKRAKEHESQLSTLETQHTQRLSEQEKLHTDGLERADEKRREELATLQGKHEAELETERIRTIETERKWELILAQVAKTHQAEEIEWKQALDKEKVRSTERLDEEAQKHKIDVEKLEKLCQKLQELFTQRNDYSGLTDIEILRGVASKGVKLSIVGFTNIVSKVTTFAEWEWREHRKIWPKDAMTSLVGTKQRRLKKLILGDAIWRILFQLIFCSPFRVLGEEGKNLEEEWNRNFPSDDEESSSEYRWPTPTVICEKYRWETCEAALDSLTKPSSPYGPLRSSFVNNQAQFNERFLETMEAYVELTEKKEQDLLKFLTEAVRMWLVFCTQRYRIRMIIPGSSESDPEKKMKLAQEQNDFKFTVAPRLQRHGNAKGTQLQEVSVVSGCDGKMAMVHESQS